MRNIGCVILSGATKLRSRMISIYSVAAVLMTLLVACGDDSSSSPDVSGNLSSSSVVSGSSSSVIPGSDPESSSSVKSSSLERQPESGSSSVDKEELSSSAASSSSSFVMPVPCKAGVEDDCEYGTLEDGRDHKIYKTVKFGNQWWMAENLNYADSVKTDRKSVV